MIDPINTTALDGAACGLCGEDATGHDRIGSVDVPTCDRCHAEHRLEVDPDQPWYVPPMSAWITQQYRESLVARQIADVCAQLVAEVPLAHLDVEDRAWLHAVADQFVNDVMTQFDVVPEQRGQ